MKSIKKQSNQPRLADHHSLIITFKNSIAYTLNILKILKIPPKHFPDNEPQTLLAYARYLENSLKLLYQDLPKVSTPISNLHKLQTAYAQAERTIQEVTREAKNQYIQYKILEEQMKNLKDNQYKLKQENFKLKKVGADLEKKVQKIQKQSLDGIQRVIQAGSQKLRKDKRKQSLPTLVSNSTKQKVSLIWMMDGFTGSSKKNEKYVEHLLRKY